MKIIFFLLRILSLGIFVFILLNPVRSKGLIIKKENPVAVLVDNSASMNFKNPVSRYEQAIKFLEKHSKLQKTKRLQFFTFSESMQLTNIDALLKIKKPTGNSTNIGEALQEIIEKSSDKFDGIVLISDGINHGDVDPVKLAANSSIPVNTVLVKDKNPIKDIAITGIKHSEVLFKNVPSTIEVELSAVGFNDEEIDISMKSEKLYHKKSVRISSDIYNDKISFKITPDKLGHVRYTFEVEPLKGELSKVNNRKVVAAEVVKEKVRVLLIAGRPSWGYKYLRHLLKSDPGIELVTFIILREANDVMFFPDNELTLIPFPTHEMFTKDLAGFDLLIFDNFPTSMYVPPEYLTNINKFIIEKGGGFLMIGGENSFGAGKYAQTPLAEILPVYIGNEKEEFSQSKTRLVPQNLTHPIMNLSEDEKENEKVWRDLPIISGFNEIGKAKEGSIVLGTMESFPVLSIWEKGKGRVVSFASPNSWLWATELAEISKPTTPYHIFWHNMIRWLIKSPEINPVKFISTSKRLLAGENFTVTVRVLDRFYHPVNEADVNLEVMDPKGNVSMFRAKPGSVDGHYVWDGKFETTGNYSFKAIASAKGNLIGTSEMAIELLAVSLETNDIMPRESLLNEIAKSSRGKFTTIDNSADEIFDFPKDVSPKEEIGRIYPIWHSWWVLIPLCFFLLLEWYLRRRAGLS